MSRHLQYRRPNETQGFAWGRVLTDDANLVTYRLFRRDHKNALHSHAVSVFSHTERKVLAGQLRRARRHLRDLVDEIDLRAMGVEA